MSRLSMTTAVRVRPPFQTVENNCCFDSYPMSNVLRCGPTLLATVSDLVFGCQVNQDEFFYSTVKHKLDLFIKGENISVIAFGDHYSGKSFTLFGPGLHCIDSEAHFGMLPRAATYLFSNLEPPNVFFPDNNNISSLIKLEMSIFEVFDKGLRDLLDTKNNRFMLVPGEKGDLTVCGATTVRCECPRDVINLLQVAMANRQVSENLTHPTSVIVKLELHHPVYRDGETKIRVSQAIFTDLACGEHPPSMWNVSDGVIMGLDYYVLSVLTKTHGGASHNDDIHILYMREYLIFLLLQDSFNGRLNTLAICCISPCARFAEKTWQYLSLIRHITYLRLPKLDLNKPNINHSIDENRQQQQSTLISEAESLLSRLSMSKSFSEDEREQFSNWLHLKQEYEEESVNGQAQSHGQPLECIEEVTESEEEVPSSNEKMSESNVMATPYCESDQDECENKVSQISDSDFYDKLDNVCFQFSDFVENFLEDFHVMPVFTPAKECKRVCSAARRGGLSSMPPMNEAQRENEAKSAQPLRDFVSANPTNVQLTKSSPKENYNKCQPLVEDPKIQAEKTPINEKNIEKWLENEETRVRKVRETWVRWRKEANDVKDTTISQEVKVLRAEKSKDMFQAVEGLTYFLDLIEDIMDLDIVTSEPNELLVPFCHRVRQHRKARHQFSRLKSQLDSKVKDKTSTEVELRDHLMCDEIIESFDMCIEHINNVLIKKKIPTSNFSSNTKVGKLVVDELTKLSISEMRHLIFRLFTKVIDLRESGKTLEGLITELDRKLDLNELKISALCQALQEMREQQTTSKAMMLQPSTNHPVPPTHLALQEGAAGGGPVTIPQQNLHKLQAKPVPPTKVTYTPRKLIIEKKTSKH
ncbi:chromosome-associated kinesin KIF4A-like isoform X1 [Homalodisca vitripennis]|uniref:chromosome-associated kinesin KIF4A-like isoform X1 n=1 Tax=Homalodisca vitripennis TaxID=197043 RepID=UPI001EE9D848|nr:chromosome-associated kinesin KIF4A-like isoform X1 [Homalodisca vitripennis]XP_046681997.1 chromosome-associated kinesin KIF4A-like isoform X1 [Homalodisca vitripennis]